MGQIVQYGTITLTKYADADFNLSTNPADSIQIVKANLDSDVDNIIFNLTRPTATKNTGAGTTLMYSTPGGEAKAEVNVYEDADRAVYDFLYGLAFPDSLLNDDGKFEHFTQPGVDYTEFTNVVHFDFVPISTEELPDESKRIVIERAVVVLEESQKMGQPNSIKASFMGQGGLRKAELVTLADLSSPIDLSVGGTNKFVSMTMNGQTIDVDFNQEAVTTRDDIKDIINDAFIATVAFNSVTPTPDTLLLKSTVFGAPIVLEDPSVGTSGLLLIFGFGVREFVKGIAPRITK